MLIRLEQTCEVIVDHHQHHHHHEDDDNDFDVNIENLFYIKQHNDKL